MSVPELDVTWDAAKAQSNLAKHGVSFAQATTVLTDRLALTVFDAAHSETEERWFTLGESSDGKLLAGAYVPANRAKPCTGAHDFSTRSHAPRTRIARERIPIGEPMSKKQTAHDDDMPAEIDFSKGVRGKFYHTGAKFNLPVYLDDQVQTRLAALASAKGVDLSTLVNDLLRKDIGLTEMAR